MKNVVLIDRKLSHTISAKMRAILDLEVVHGANSGFSVAANRLNGHTGSIDQMHLSRLLFDGTQPAGTPASDNTSMEQSLRLIANVFQNDIRFRALCQVDENARQALAAVGAELPPVMLKD